MIEKYSIRCSTCGELNIRDALFCSKCISALNVTKLSADFISQMKLIPYIITKIENFEFKGFIEGNHLMDGNVNVIVADGFTGNIALKTAEGTANFITSELKQAMTSSIFGKLGSLISSYSLKKFKQKLDPRLYNGCLLYTSPSPRDRG